MTAFDDCVIHLSGGRRFNAFYHDVLNAEVIPDVSGGYAYRVGPVQLSCHGPGTVGEPRREGP